MKFRKYLSGIWGAKCWCTRSLIFSKLRYNEMAVCQESWRWELPKALPRIQVTLEQGCWHYTLHSISDSQPVLSVLLITGEAEVFVLCHWFLSDLSSLGNCNYPWEGIFTRLWPEVTCRLWCSVAPPSPCSADFIVVTAGWRVITTNSEKIREAAAKKWTLPTLILRIMQTFW